MTALSWILLLALSALLGSSLVKYLTVHPLQMSLYLILASLSFSALVVLIARGFRGRRRLLAVLLGLALFAGSYLLQTRQVLAQEDTRSRPELTRQKGDQGDGHTAVIYFTHGEPETYNPIGWLNQFREFDEQKITFVPFFARPVFIYELRQAYLKVGTSHHRQMHIQMLKQLEAAFRAEGDASTKFYLSFLDDEPRPDAAVIQALNEGASRIVVAEVFVSISNHTAEGEELIKEVQAEEYGAPILFTGPMWESATLHRSFLEKANAAIGDTDKAKVGVILVGHGQPDEWDEDFPTETSQELGFRELVLKQLEADGYRRENMGLAWMSFKEPKPAVKVEELVKNGVEKIIYFSAAISAESIHSQYDIPELVAEGKVPAGLPVINLGAWNDHPLVLQAIQEMIEEQMKSGGG